MRSLATCVDPRVPDHRLSANPWVDQRCRDVLASASRWLIQELAPRGLRALFLGGSAALGEALGGTTGSGLPLVLSDLDVSAVMRHRLDPEEESRLLQGLRDSSGITGRENGPALTLGLYEERHLARQDPTPGLVDLVQAGWSLWGAEALLGRFEVPAPDRIPPWEGIRLVGNRSLELLLAPDPEAGPADRMRALYALAKASTGLWTAWLLFAGRYQVGWGARARLLGGDLARQAPPEAVAAARAWMAFQEAPEEARGPGWREGLLLFQRGLAALLREATDRWHLDDPLPEEVFLKEPITLRARLRAWWREAKSRGEQDPRGGRQSGRQGGLWALRAGLRGTPRARRLAAATLYFRLFPEDLERGGVQSRPRVNEPGPEAHVKKDEPLDWTWENGVHRLLGRRIPSGPGCREDLLRALALRSS